ncbi:WLM-domain-containing protein [Testicularia cyperi]|uniref:WLM-domain-containing protein n=1 Tax=Testicularia cyperi TaxID=1882483 RepID=A0A317XF51_9BASI|nr:WLM-domain-containing protein [Testicularia cyperi]
MVHLRLNDPDTSRNKHINYITALPHYDDHEEARHRLFQLAAQVQPVMKTHGFQINSLEEYEWNREFAGRNWNNGETVELILRRQDGSFAPLQWVLMVFCHELAHIKYMNHIPSQHGKLDRELRQECRQLQARGYYGDGFWSAGQRLQDNAFVAGMRMESLRGLPEYSCGGAFSSKKASGAKRRRRRAPNGRRPRKRGFKGPSLHTGAQTAPNTKGGRRVQTDMPGQGSRVDALNSIPKASAASASYKNDANSTFRKRTQTASARELRAQAALRRFDAMKREHSPLNGDEKKVKPERQTTMDRTWASGFTASTVDSDSDSDTEEEDADEDEDSGDSDGGLVIDVDADSSEHTSLHTDANANANANANAETTRTPGSAVKPEPESHDFSTQASRETTEQRRERARLYRQHEKRQGGQTRTTAEEWWDFCVDGSMDRLRVARDDDDNVDNDGPTTGRAKGARDQPIELLDSDDQDDAATPTPTSNPVPHPSQQWSCEVCTLFNPASALRCEACATTKGSFLVGQ